MRLYPPRPEIAEGEGFEHHNIFRHQSFGDNLMTLLERVEHPLVVALNGDWGSGKTTFIRMWKGHAEQNGFSVIYFDAFAHDYQEDAFLALAGQVLAHADIKLGLNDEEKADVVNAYKDKAAAVGKSLMRAGVKVGINAITLGVVNGDEQIDHFERYLSNELANAVDRCVSERLDQQAEEAEIFKNFRGELSALSARLKSDRPLVIIIDDLDRCRPSFALDLLEKAKHFFSVEGVHFILVTNLEQLCNSVCARYGPNIDARTYLERFIDLVTFLPEMSDRHTSVMDVFLRRTIDQLNFDSSRKHLRVEIFEQLLLISRNRSLTFRKIEKIYTLLGLCLMQGRNVCESYIPLTVGLCVLRVEDEELYKKAKFGEINAKEVMEFFNFPNIKTESECAKCLAMKQWSLALGVTLPNNFKKGVGENARRQIITEICKSMDEFRLL